MNNLNKQSTKPLMCGIDEAGRGCLAGDLVVVGSIFKERNIQIEKLMDSKKLSEKQREKLFDEIKNVTFSKIIQFSSEDVDNFGISRLLNKALNEIMNYFNSLEELKGLRINFVFDGNSRFGISQEVINFETLVKADSIIDEVSASSVLAKVTRDRNISKFAEKYPAYKFEKHKGYGTKLHREMIEKYGLTEIHRKSFKFKKVTPTLF